jgi:beta-phosphoglucomutase-like phosphatase (HAD superfamily)
VSGSTRESVIASLESLNLFDRFDTLVCAEDYQHSKPDPEGFLLAAGRLGVAPENCLVFEDTAMGIEAATAAGNGIRQSPPAMGTNPQSLSNSAAKCVCITLQNPIS